jgi:hypothetical protein
MRGPTAEFRARIDGAIDPLLALGASKAITNEEAFAAFSKLRGVLHGYSVKPGIGLSQYENLAAELKHTYRKHAQDLAEAGIEAFSVPTRRTSSPAHFQLSHEINQRAFEARNDPREGPFRYSRYLISKGYEDRT